MQAGEAPAVSQIGDGERPAGFGLDAQHAVRDSSGGPGRVASCGCEHDFRARKAVQLDDAFEAAVLHEPRAAERKGVDESGPALLERVERPAELLVADVHVAVHLVA